MEEQCGNCKYIDHFDSRCLRYPPVQNGVDYLLARETNKRSSILPKEEECFIFPPINEYDWCGEWRAKE